MILLDTNICIHGINAKPPAVLERFRQHRMGEIGLCSVVAAELAYGVAKSGSPRNRQALEMFLAPLIILPFDEAALWAYGDLRAELERKGTPICALDTMNVERVPSVIGQRPEPANCPLPQMEIMGLPGGRSAAYVEYRPVKQTVKTGREPSP